MAGPFDFNPQYATQFGRQVGTNSRTGKPIYYISDRAGYNQAIKADMDARNAGFRDFADQNMNRTLRDVFEIKLDQMGITDYNSAYSQLSGGRSLTSNMTIRDMINNVGSLGEKKTTNTGSADPGTGTNTGSGDEIDDYENSNKGYEDLLASLGDMFQQPDPMQAVGGPGSALDGGATGFRRKRSSARMAGLTNKGTSALKITGQTSKSSGLNIG